jgi:hypothetical protein
MGESRSAGNYMKRAAWRRHEKPDLGALGNLLGLRPLRLAETVVFH